MISTRAMRSAAAVPSRAMATRRIRRTNHNRLYCSTNGCASFMLLDQVTGVATCPVCGLRRLVH